MACFFTRTEIIALMVKLCSKLDVELISKNGFNCLHWLAISERDENNIGCVNLLVNYLFRQSEMDNDDTSVANSEQEALLERLDRLIKR